MRLAMRSVMHRTTPSGTAPCPTALASPQPAVPLVPTAAPRRTVAGASSTAGRAMTGAFAAGMDRTAAARPSASPAHVRGSTPIAGWSPTDAAPCSTVVDALRRRSAGAMGRPTVASARRPPVRRRTPIAGACRTAAGVWLSAGIVVGGRPAEAVGPTDVAPARAAPSRAPSSVLPAAGSPTAVPKRSPAANVRRRTPAAVVGSPINAGVSRSPARTSAPPVVLSIRVVASSIVVPAPRRKPVAGEVWLTCAAALAPCPTPSPRAPEGRATSSPAKAGGATATATLPMGARPATPRASATAVGATSPAPFRTPLPSATVSASLGPACRGSTTATGWSPTDARPISGAAPRAAGPAAPLAPCPK